ncbi:MAG: Tim44/TimA family putative adaptor protein [Hyphomicrobiaceae bacterium]|nr:Tim44/TimA family putative adaptor protein [Hyphomicrobiaceae bacterium]
MDGTFNVTTLVFLVIAVVIFLKLRSVLGRRTGDEETRFERYKQQEAQREAAAARDKIITLPRREREEPTPKPVAEERAAGAVEERVKTIAGANADVAKGLMDIARSDSTFDPDGFIKGAKVAYEIIVTSFAEGNKRALKDLLSREVFEGFSGAITERESRGEVVEQTFVGMKSAEIVDADVKGGTANVTVKFLSELITATRDRAGEVIFGDPKKIKEVTDIWTFSREVGSRNPNWRLIATQAAN